MLFEITDEQEMLREVARRFVREEYDFARRRAVVESALGHNPELWARFAEMGWLALPFAEDDGGLGGGPVELLLLMEAFGAGLVVEPYLGAVVLGGGAVAEAASAAQRERLLPPLLAGEGLLALAFAEPELGYELAPQATRARPAGNGWALSGHKAVVLAAPAAARTHPHGLTRPP